MTQADQEEMLALIQAVNHEGETSTAWTTLKAKLKLLLATPHLLSAAFDAGVADNVAAEKRFFQDIKDSIAERRSTPHQASGQHEETS